MENHYIETDHEKSVFLLGCDYATLVRERDASRCLHILQHVSQGALYLDAAHIQRLLDLFLNHADPGLRGEFAYLVGRSKRRTFGGALAERLRTEKEAWVVDAIERALQQIGYDNTPSAPMRTSGAPLHIGVLVASPGDLETERMTAKNTVDSWRKNLGDIFGVLPEPVLWELDTPPESAKRTQEVINRYLVERSAILVALFWTRLGTPTGGYLSGTAEEISRFDAAGKPVLLFRSNRAVKPGKIDPLQLQGLDDFLRKRGGLIENFAGEHGELDARLYIRLTQVIKERFTNGGANSLLSKIDSPGPNPAQVDG